MTPEVWQSFKRYGRDSLGYVFGIIVICTIAGVWVYPYDRFAIVKPLLQRAALMFLGTVGLVGAMEFAEAVWGVNLIEKASEDHRSAAIILAAFVIAVAWITCFVI